ncbi:class I SAM-dependent methyltransferase [Desulfosarcina ovata]|uniref:Class I SAM-dependent methyltransferase n=2 Tax=Desulfosarcina ovata TaxID=83564 RepID=A0A5K8AD20_9BACT|nr:methyltransferase domain-containing protein [Desulfosarcina ovata]BBO83973.1 class I SAM-dependent methyltransferase [Desulfosarcina ovata subsp. sediminis]BBO90451.1 class I SAM-dependent methyltransferase [Desulfosarcina ovata subsp. ovata]
MPKLCNPQSESGYRLMVWTFRLMDLFAKPDRHLDAFDLKKEMVVVDYGCGPGRYLRKAAQMVGPDGKVFAADVHPMAIDLVKRKIEKHRLTNVVPVLLDDQPATIAKQCADVVYALDMFHQVDDPVGFLADIHRIIKHEGVFYLEDGHQDRSQSLGKVRRSNHWRVIREHKRFIELRTRRD